MESITDKVRDHSLVYKKHNAFTHLGCVALRSVLGLSLIQDNISKRHKRFVFIIMIITLIMFSYKYVRYNLYEGQTFWKNYLRFIMIYSMSIYLMSKDKHQYAGMLMIMDAMMGLESRHTAHVLTKIIL